MVHTKSLMLNGAISKNELHKANDREIERLVERFNSDDFSSGVNDFLQRKMLKKKL